jgi:hypothetical protein
MQLREQFIAAVAALHSPNSSTADRKGAEAWLVQFRKSEEGWHECLSLLADHQQPADVQLLAAQCLRPKARLAQSAGNREVHRALQHGLLQAAQQGLDPKTLQQVSLACATVTLPLVDQLPGVLMPTLAHMPVHTALVMLEALAEEASTLLSCGPGGVQHSIQH